MKIKNVQEYIDTIEKLIIDNTYDLGLVNGGEMKPHFLYRGHSNHEKYKLEPQIMRELPTQSGSITEYSQLEYNILSDFISESCAYQKNIDVHDILGWLELAQHYGVPTRLMDLTENPLIALYFACRSRSKYDASVWVVNETEYLKRYWDTPMFNLVADSQNKVHNIIYSEIISSLGQIDQQNLIRYEYPWIYKPCYREERMKLQSSYFMIWGKNRASLEKLIDKDDYMKLEKDSSAIGVMCPIVIPAEHKENILTQLDIIGINEKFIYPGLDGIGKTISNKYHAKS